MNQRSTGLSVAQDAYTGGVRMNRRPSGSRVAQAARLFGALDVHRRLAVENSYPFMLREREKLLAGSRAQLGKKPPAKPGLRTRR